MATNPTEAQLAKLPKWAQEHIEDLRMQREAAIRALAQFTDEQTPAPFWCDDMHCTGEEAGPTQRKRFISTRSVYVRWAGVEVRVQLHDDDSCHHKSIGVYASSNRLADDVAFVPVTRNGIAISSARYLRDTTPIEGGDRE